MACNRSTGLVLIACSLFVASCGEEAKPVVKAQPSTPASPPPTKPAEEKPKAPEPKPEAKPVETTASPTKVTLPTYTVRGEIDALPGIESSVLRLHHERIPTFASKDGKVGKDSQGKPGMKPMTMAFAKNPDVSYDGLKVGDKVEVIIEIRWDAPNHEDMLCITKLTKLAPETKLDFEGQPSRSDPKPTPKPETK